MRFAGGALDELVRGQAHRRNRSPANACGHLDSLVVNWFGRGVQDFCLVQGGEAFRFIVGLVAVQVIGFSCGMVNSIERGGAA